MSPKFRGDSNDWLDEEDSNKKQRGSKKGKKPQGFIPVEGESLPLEQANSVVAEVFPNLCRVTLLEDAQAPLLCSYRRVGVMSGTADKRERSPVAVGDRTLVEKTGKDSGVVVAVCARRNTLTRPAPGGESNRVHVLAANVDLLVIVASTIKPDFAPGLVDRFLVAAEAEKIRTIICVTKVDLPLPESTRLWEGYRALGYKVLEVSSKTSAGLPELLAEMGESETVFCGHSGVGKTSLLQKLLGQEIGRVAQVNESTGRGRHTTTSAVRYLGPKEQGWIDTPGVREFGLAGITPELLAGYFPEFHGLPCAVKSCLHLEEEGCVARSLFRYTSYQRIMQSLMEEEAPLDPRKARAPKASSE